MQIKQPPVYDTSHWKVIPDFALVQPKPLLVLTKATEAATYTDPTFQTYFADLKQDGILRGAYHFHRKAYNPVLQAEHFVNTVAPVIGEGDLLALDVEEGGETAAQIIQFIERVRAALNNRILIYSRKNLLDPISMFLSRILPERYNSVIQSAARPAGLNAIQMTIAEREYLKTFPIWTAGYPWFPDNYAAVPAAYIPDQTKWGPVALWQYTASATVQGISGGTDANWIAPWFVEQIKPTQPPASQYPSTVTLHYGDDILKTYVPE